MGAKMMRSARSLASVLCISSMTGAPTLAAQPAPAQPIKAIIYRVPDASALRAGTSIQLRLDEELGTRTPVGVGQRFQMEVVEPVMVSGQIVIPAGSPAIGEVTAIHNRTMWGQGERIDARPLFVHAHGRDIRLTGRFHRKGSTTSRPAPIRAVLDEDVPVAFVSSCTAPSLVAQLARRPVSGPSDPAVKPAD